MRSGAIFLVALAIVCGAAAIPTRADAPAPPAETMTTKEEALWQSILALNGNPPTSQPYDAWTAQREKRQAQQLRMVKSYITLYPGGTHHEEAIRLELQLLYELSVLRGEPPTALRDRVSELLSGLASQQTREEAAYWDLVAHQAEPEPGNAAEALASRARKRLEGYREYIQHYPDSRYVPQLALRVFADAEDHGRWVEARQLTTALMEHFPGNPATEWVQARLWRHDAVGRHVWLTTGRPVLVVVWASYDDASRATLPRIEAFRQAHADLRVVGVSLDMSYDDFQQAVSALGIDWPQSCDGLGWGGWFARRWGTRQLPEVFVIDSEGCLVGIAGPEGWEAMASEVVATPDLAGPGAGTAN